MMSIPLKGAGGGHSVVIDEDDYEWLSKMYWYVVKVKNKSAHGSYFSVRTILRRVWDDGFTWHRATTMHRVILDHHGFKCDGFFVDHINDGSLGGDGGLDVRAGVPDGTQISAGTLEGADAALIVTCREEQC